MRPHSLGFRSPGGNPGSLPFGIWSPVEIAVTAQCPQAEVEANWPLVFAALVAAGQGSVRSQAGAIGTIAVETASTFRPVREAYWLSKEAAYAYYADTSKHAAYDGGPDYHGRGLNQLTHRYNYLKIGDAIGVHDLASNPDKAMEPATAAKIFAEYWRARDVQGMADADDWMTLRKAVVGYVANPPGYDRVRNVAISLVNMARSRGAL